MTSSHMVQGSTPQVRGWYSRLGSRGKAGAEQERKKDVYSQRKGKDIYVHELEVSPECAEYEIEFRG